jgi:hypothetical protein
MLKNVRSCLQSFRVLTHPDFSEFSGTMPKESPDVVFDDETRERLWDVLCEMTGTEDAWPEPLAERQPLPKPGENQESLYLPYGQSEDTWKRKLRYDDEQEQKLIGPMALSSFNPELKGNNLPWPKPMDEYYTGYFFSESEEGGWIIFDDPNNPDFNDEEPIWCARRHCTGFANQLPMNGTKVNFNLKQDKDYIPLGDISDWLRFKFKPEDVRPDGMPLDAIYSPKGFLEERVPGRVVPRTMVQRKRREREKVLAWRPDTTKKIKEPKRWYLPRRQST